MSNPPSDSAPGLKMVEVACGLLPRSQSWTIERNVGDTLLYKRSILGNRAPVLPDVLLGFGHGGAPMRIVEQLLGIHGQCRRLGHRLVMTVMGIALFGTRSAPQESSRGSDIQTQRLDQPINAHRWAALGGCHARTGHVLLASKHVPCGERQLRERTAWEEPPRHVPYSMPRYPKPCTMPTSACTASPQSSAVYLRDAKCDFATSTRNPETARQRSVGAPR